MAVWTFKGRFPQISTKFPIFRLKKSFSKTVFNWIAKSVAGHEVKKIAMKKSPINLSFSPSTISLFSIQFKARTTTILHQKFSLFKMSRVHPSTNKNCARHNWTITIIMFELEAARTQCSQSAWITCNKLMIMTHRSFVIIIIV